MAIDATLTGANLAQTVEGVASTRQQRPFRQGAGKKNPRRSETYNGAPDKSAASEAAKEQKRILDGQMVVEGEQVVVGDTAAAEPGVVEYEVLCRRHYTRRMNSHFARAAADDADVLPFDLDVCPLPPPVR